MTTTLRCEPGTLGGRLPVPVARSVGTLGDAFSVCRLCHGPARPGRATCWSCEVVRGQLDGFETRIAPVFCYAAPSGAHDALVGYKASPVPLARGAWAEALATLLAEHLRRHLSCLCRPAGRGPLEGVALVPVPSSIGGRGSWGGEHPLAGVCRQAADQLGEDRVEVLDLLRAGVRPAGRLSAGRAGFAVDGELSRRRVIVVDDVFTSGARILSAAAALSDAGGRVPAAVPLGRLLRPDHSPASAAYFRHLTAADPVRSGDARCPWCRSAPGVVRAWAGRRLVARMEVALAERAAEAQGKSSTARRRRATNRPALPMMAR